MSFFFFLLFLVFSAFFGFLLGSILNDFKNNLSRFLMFFDCFNFWLNTNIFKIY